MDGNLETHRALYQDNRASVNTIRKVEITATTGSPLCSRCEKISSGSVVTLSPVTVVAELR